MLEWKFMWISEEEFEECKSKLGCIYSAMW